MNGNFINMEIQPSDFNDIVELRNYIDMTYAGRTKRMAIDMLPFFRSTDYKTYYYYNSTSKVWEPLSFQEFVNYIVIYNSNLIDTIRSKPFSNILHDSTGYNQTLRQLDTRNYCEDMAKLCQSYICEPDFLNKSNYKVVLNKTNLDMLNTLQTQIDGLKRQLETLANRKYKVVHVDDDTSEQPTSKNCGMHPVFIDDDEEDDYEEEDDDIEDAEVSDAERKRIQNLFR